jgi:hypothetical protein
VNQGFVEVNSWRLVGPSSFYFERIAFGFASVGTHGDSQLQFWVARPSFFELERRLRAFLVAFASKSLLK